MELISSSAKNLMNASKRNWPTFLASLRKLKNGARTVSVSDNIKSQTILGPFRRLFSQIGWGGLNPEGGKVKAHLS